MIKVYQLEQLCLKRPEASVPAGYVIPLRRRGVLRRVTARSAVVGVR